MTQPKLNYLYALGAVHFCVAVDARHWTIVRVHAVARRRRSGPLGESRPNACQPACE